MYFNLLSAYSYWSLLPSVSRCKKHPEWMSKAKLEVRHVCQWNTPQTRIRECIAAFCSWAVFIHSPSPQPYSISDMLRRDCDPIFSLPTSHETWQEAGGRRWEIMLLCSRVSFKWPDRLDAASEEHSRASQGWEIPGVKMRRSTLECILQPQLHTGSVYM